MRIRGIDHFTVRCTAAELNDIKAFYSRVLGMSAGPRPDFEFPGFWMYADGRALVHLAAHATTEAEVPHGQAQASGLDHIALRAEGLEDTRQKLRQLGVAFYELPVPGRELHQVFLLDPTGTKIELTFDQSRSGS